MILDSDWEAEFCRVAEAHPRVRAYVKNHSLGLEVPYRYGSEMRRYLPDFIVLVDDGHGDEDLLHLIVEIKGYRREDAKEKKATMDTYWVPGVNNLGNYRPLGLRRIHRGLSDRGRLQGEGRKRVQQDDRDSRGHAVGSGSVAMAKKKPNGRTVETLTHDEATRKNIPTAEYQSVMQKDEQAPVPVAYARGRPGLMRKGAAQPRPRPATRLARQGSSRIGPISSSTRRRSTSRRRSTPRS